MKVDLHNQTALVTGAARGIGFGIAKLLAENGAHVVVADIDETAAKAAAAELSDAMAVRMDVSCETDVEAGVTQIKSEFGNIDILVNNAGINTVKHRVTIDQFPVSEWDKIMGVDLRGVFLVSRAVSREMLARGAGRIVNIASVAGIVPLRLQCAYTSAKAGVINLTRTMAIELAAKGIAVNCVAPGSILTEMTRKVFYAEDATMSQQAMQLLNHIPMGRVGTVEEIARATLFFVDPQTTYTTGQVLSVDGGWSAGGFFRDF